MWYLIFLMDHIGKNKTLGADAVKVFMFSEDLFKLCYGCIYVFKSTRGHFWFPDTLTFQQEDACSRVGPSFTPYLYKRKSNRSRGFR